MKKIIAILFIASTLFNCTSKSEPITNNIDPITNINSILFIRDTITFYPNEQVSNGILASNQTIDMVYYQNTNISFYENGQVNEGRLASNQTIDMVYYSASSISFYSNGQVREGTLRKETIIYGIKYRAGDISFYPDGKVSNGILASNHTIKGYNLCAYNPITFYENGNLNLISIFYSDSLDLAPLGKVRRGILKGNPLKISNFFLNFDDRIPVDVLLVRC